MEPVLSLDRVRFGYGSRRVLHDISLQVHQGEILGILGPNGSGKSTLLKVMDGIVLPDAGEVKVNGAPLRHLDRGAVAKQIAVVSQEDHFRFPFSVKQVVMMGRFPHLKALQFEGERAMAVVHEALEVTYCLELSDRSIHELSGGERQRVLIARALAQEPAVILLDEPTSFLDLRFKRGIFRLIEHLSRAMGLSVVVVSHDIDLISQYCSRVLLLKDGAIFSIGGPQQVISASNVEAVYECPVHVDQHPVTGKPRVTIL